MTNLQQLHQKRAELLAEQEELSLRVPQMEAAWKAMPGTYNVHGNKIISPEAHAAMEETSQAASRLHTIPRLIETIEAEIAYEERCANAEGDIARHNEEAKAAEALAASLEVQLGQLTARLESLRHEIKQAEEDAEKDQQDAAQAIARATASGDSKAEKAAQVKLGAAMLESPAMGLAPASDRSFSTRWWRGTTSTMSTASFSHSTPRNAPPGPPVYCTACTQIGPMRP